MQTSSAWLSKWNGLQWSKVPWVLGNPIGFMYGKFTYIYHKNQPNVGRYAIHGSCLGKFHCQRRWEFLRLSDGIFGVVSQGDPLSKSVTEKFPVFFTTET